MLVCNVFHRPTGGKFLTLAGAYVVGSPVDPLQSPHPTLGLPVFLKH